MYDTQQLGYPVLLESWLVSTLSAYQKFQEVLWGKGWNDDFCMLVTLNLYRFSHQFGTIKNENNQNPAQWQNLQDDNFSFLTSRDKQPIPAHLPPRHSGSAGRAVGGIACGLIDDYGSLRK